MGYRIENHCVVCPPDLGCMGNACINRNVTVFFCDDCKTEVETNELYLFKAKGNERELCEECWKERMLDDAETVQSLIDKNMYFDE